MPGTSAPRDRNAAPGSALSPAFWLYAVAAAFVAFGFADYPLIAFHFAKAQVVSQAIVPVLYAAAMGASGLGSLVFGRWFDTARPWRARFPDLSLARRRHRWCSSGASRLPLRACSPGARPRRARCDHVRGRGRDGPGIRPGPRLWHFHRDLRDRLVCRQRLAGMLYDVSIAGLVVVSVAAELAALVPLVFALRRLAIKQA